MSVILTLAVTFFAGMGAGLGTGFAGMSAVLFDTLQLGTNCRFQLGDLSYQFLSNRGP